MNLFPIQATKIKIFQKKFLKFKTLKSFCKLRPNFCAKNNASERLLL